MNKTKQKLPSYIVLFGDIKCHSWYDLNDYAVYIPYFIKKSTCPI